VAAVAILLPVLALGLPVMDTLAVMAARFLRRETSLPERFAGMFRADRSHLHHLLEELTSRRRLVWMLYLAGILFCAMTLLVAITRNAQLGFALLGVELGLVLLLRALGRFRRGEAPAAKAVEPEAPANVTRLRRGA
jgi:UDP-GlcNAc:undecaprenyl-phosphate/decaprenyl-phosphate GlcNAc-1-phosphate transferase